MGFGTFTPQITRAGRAHHLVAREFAIHEPCLMRVLYYAQGSLGRPGFHSARAMRVNLKGNSARRPSRCPRSPQIVNNIPPQDLRVFILAARRASFAAAAEDLGASPAYVSKRIALIEHTLKVKLFHRSTRRVSLTERGERMLVWAQRVLDTYDQVDSALDEMQGHVRGTLRIAASSGL